MAEIRDLTGITNLDRHYRELARSPIPDPMLERCPHARMKVISRSGCSMCRASLGEELPISRPAVPLSHTIRVNASALGGFVREVAEDRRARKPEREPAAYGRGNTSEATIQEFLRAVDAGIPQRGPALTQSRPIDDAKLRRLWSEGKSNIAIAAQFGVSRETVRMRAKALGLKRDEAPAGFMTAREARRRLGDRVAELKPHPIYTQNGRRAKHVFAIADVEKLKQEMSK